MKFTPRRFESIFLGLFLFWSACGILFTLFQVTPATLDAKALPFFLKHFISLCLGLGDEILIILAFATTHLLAARRWSLVEARRWALLILLGSWAVETLGTATGFPFGAYHYTDRFGPRLGLVPLTIPLAWHVVLTNVLLLVQSRVRGHVRALTPLLCGLLCALYDVALEPFACRARLYWWWEGGTVPIQNYVAWFFVSALLIRLFAPAPAAGIPQRDLRPLLILGTMLVIFILGARI